MGSSKKSKDKDRERDKGDKEHKRKRRHRSRSRSKERKHRESKRPRGEPFEREQHESREDYGRKPRSSHAVHDEGLPLKKEEPGDGGFSDFANQASGGGGGGDISLSIQETNRLRAKLGLKPLEVESVKPEGEEDQKPGTTQSDVHKPAVNLGQLKETESIKQRLLEIKEKRRINQKLGKVKTLADSDSDDEGALAWIKKSRKLEKEKELAEKRAKVLAEMDEEFGIGSLVDQEFKPDQKKVYDSKHLSGLRVEHDQDRFKEGTTTILTLKDKRILDEDDDDVLVNYNIIDDEKAELNVTNKKKLPDYNPYDEPTIDEYGMVQSKNLLSKYDEEIEGKKLSSFEIGSGGKYDARHERTMQEFKSAMQKQAQTLDLPAPLLAKEFHTQEEMESFKKVKKKVRKIRKKPKAVKADDLMPLGTYMQAQDLGRRQGAGEEAMDTSQAIPGLDLVENDPVDEEEALGPESDLTGVPVEDEHSNEHERILRKAQRLKDRHPDVSQEEGIAARMKPSNEASEEQLNTGWASSVTLNATSEFCRALGDIPTYGQAGNRPEEEEDELTEFERELAEERARQQEDDEHMAAGWQEVDYEPHSVDIADEERLPLEEEPVLNAGMASALHLADKKGFLDLENSKKAAAAQRSHTTLDSQHYSIEDKRYDDIDDKYRKRDRFSGGVTQDFKELSYKPNVKLEYVDETGRLLNPKEAFRQLSHRFHGKGSGKKKTEKRSKKLEQDMLLKGASSTDTPLGTVELLREKQRSEQSPYLILSGANKATLTGGQVNLGR